MIIAIDGFSSCGKSTLAKDLSAKLNIAYIDTGAMYRAVALYLLQNNIHVEDQVKVAESLNDIHIEFQRIYGVNTTFLNGRNVESEIRDKPVSDIVSPVATIPAVREKLVAIQRKASQNGNGLIMDGRDIGTVVFPEADFKFFITSSIEERTRRRYQELIAKGKNVTKEEVKQNLISRDQIDSTRAHSPLKKAADAIEIDNTYLNREEQLEVILDYIAFHSKNTKIYK
jgi:cytidylate kinase